MYIIDPNFDSGLLVLRVISIRERDDHGISSQMEYDQEGIAVIAMVTVREKDVFLRAWSETRALNCAHQSLEKCRTVSASPELARGWEQESIESIEREHPTCRQTRYLPMGSLILRRDSRRCNPSAKPTP